MRSAGLGYSAFSCLQGLKRPTMLVLRQNLSCPHPEDAQMEHSNFRDEHDSVERDIDGRGEVQDIKV
jgi:hypothetical protein